MDSNLELAFQAVATAIKARQEPLVSGTSIKTINGISILGGGDLVTPSSGANVAIQATEPIVSVGQKLLWVETKESGDISLWIKTGE
jgi:hypothetical protein